MKMEILHVANRTNLSPLLDRLHEVTDLRSHDSRRATSG